MLWFDLDNTPHVPLFRPVFKELEKKNKEFFVTARDFAQTKELLNNFHIDFTLIGKHGGKNKVNKIFNLFERANELNKVIKDKGIHLAVSHGSRTQLVAAKRRNIPSILMLDYEYTESRIFNFLATHLLIPVYIPDKRLKEAGFNLKKVIRYKGFKEELYLKDFVPDKNFREIIGVDNEKILVVFRPPSMTGNYHDHRSEELLTAGLKYFSQDPGTICLIVNRTATERNFIEKEFSYQSNIKFLEKAVDGLQLLFSADIAISGGGTMNREAALLGTETYSIFTGRRPYLDEYLQDLKKLKFIESPLDFLKIPIQKKEKHWLYNSTNNLAEEITDLICGIAVH